MWQEWYILQSRKYWTGFNQQKFQNNHANHKYIYVALAIVHHQLGQFFATKRIALELNSAIE